MLNRWVEHTARYSAASARPAPMVQVVALVRPEMRVEIEAYAVIDAAA
jgi:enamine deaminase RidA (YjgF/YER057c/UK114 family)